MTAIAQARLRSVASLADGVVAFARAVADSWTRARAYRATYAELSALSDRELDDLGVSRWELAEVAYKSVYGA
jgi:uncharacterized protein YjiS (DUF1127 family)